MRPSAWTPLAVFHNFFPMQYMQVLRCGTAIGTMRCIVYVMFSKEESACIE
jgi:hypothetical protein